MMDKGQISRDADTLKHSIGVLRTIIQYEETTGVLYSTYAEIFTENQAFWLQLALEEAEHAQAAKDLMNILIHQDIRLDLERHEESHFFELLTEASRLVANAGGMDELGATAAAISLESTTVERKLFDTVASDADELREAFAMFRDEYEDHVSRLRQHASQLADQTQF